MSNSFGEIFTLRSGSFITIQHTKKQKTYKISGILLGYNRDEEGHYVECSEHGDYCEYRDNCDECDEARSDNELSITDLETGNSKEVLYLGDNMIKFKNGYKGSIVAFSYKNSPIVVLMNKHITLHFCF